NVPGERVGDMEVVGPTGRRVLLRAVPGLTYPGFGLAVPRLRFDALLHQAAVEAGAEAIEGRADEPHYEDDGRLAGFRVERGETRGLEVRADAVIGADGALSRVARVAGLVDERRVLWGFALRAYAAHEPSLPQILFWEPAPRQGYPGYGWLFPGAAGV